MTDRADGWRHPGWSWTVRHEWLISAGYRLATLIAGGVIGAVLSMVPDGWKAGKLWVCGVLAVVAFAVAGFSWIGGRGKKRMLERNGTAYIVYEDARFWTSQDVTRFWQGIRRQFARVVQVPGPRELARGWDWSLDDAAARDWDGRADELVRAFRVLSRDESRNGAATPNSVFIWAWWAVAFAFGMRVSAADRGLEVDVWQRPSKAREAAVYPEVWAQRPNRFDSAVPGAGLPYALSDHVWKTELAVSRRGGRARPGVNGARVIVLLVRFNSGKWGPLPSVDASLPKGQPLSLKLHDAAGLLPVGVSQAEVHELRCVPPTDGFGWETFPALAAAAVAWISEKYGEFADSTLLLGTALPQEIGLGMGILVGQETHRANWPEHLYPVAYDWTADAMVIPKLELGTAAVNGGA